MYADLEDIDLNWPQRNIACNVCVCVCVCMYVCMSDQGRARPTAALGTGVHVEGVVTTVEQNRYAGIWYPYPSRVD